jgi:hypothetical protein
MLTESIKETIETLFMSTPPEVGVAYGKKIKNNIETDEISIVFMVPKKLPLNEIPEGAKLPETIEIDGTTYNTDVIEIGQPEVYAACSTSYLSTSYNWYDLQGPNGYFWYSYSAGTDTPYIAEGQGTTPPPQIPGATPWSGPYGQHIAPGNRLSSRPLKGGISLTSYNNSGQNPFNNGYGEVGTLGFIAVDVANQALVGVTNTHVVIGDQFNTSLRNLSGPINNEYNDKTYQPGESGAIQTNEIGEVVRYVPLTTQSLNYVDGALISISSSTINNTTSMMQYGLTNPASTLPFALTAEIDGLLTTNIPLAVYTTGRTSGVKGTSGLELQITTIGTSQYINGYRNQQPVGPPNPYGTIGASFGGLIKFNRANRNCPWPIAPGDSGSALIANLGGTWKIIGLCFAGNKFDGFACRIDTVASQLGIQAWDGTTKNYLNLATKQYVTVPNGSTDKTLVCNTQTYWQVGLTNTPNPCV